MNSENYGKEGKSWEDDWKGKKRRKSKYMFDKHRFQLVFFFKSSLIFELKKAIKSPI